MTPALLDERSFDDFVSRHDTVVVGFVQQDGDAAQFSALASAVLGYHPGVCFAQVQPQSRGLFEMFGLSGTATAIFRARTGLYLEPGLPAADLLVRLLDGIRALNMQRVQAELAQEKAAAEALAVRRVCPTARRGKLP